MPGNWLVKHPQSGRKLNLSFRPKYMPPSSSLTSCQPSLDSSQAVIRSINLIEVECSGSQALTAVACWPAYPPTLHSASLPFVTRCTECLWNTYIFTQSVQHDHEANHEPRRSSSPTEHFGFRLFQVMGKVGNKISKSGKVNFTQIGTWTLRTGW